MSDLSGYRITFRRDALMGLWFWTAETPDGSTISNFGICATKEGAEKDALRRIELHSAAETLDGQSLAARVHARNIPA